MPKREPRVKNKGGRPKGSRTCQPDVTIKPSKRMVELMQGAYDDAEWMRRFKTLTPNEQFRLRGSAEPKPKEEPPGSTFNLIIEGIGNLPFLAKCPQCKHEFMASRPQVSPPVNSGAILPQGKGATASCPPVYAPAEPIPELKKPVRWSIDPGEVDLG